jgi:hypothetical protein
MRSFVLCLVLTTVSTAAGAQANCLQQIKFPAQGRWAEYQATYKETAYQVRYGVIGHERRGGKDMQWVEMRMQGGKQHQNMIYQMLVPGSLADLAKVQEIVFKTGDKPAMKMSGQMVELLRAQLDKQSIYGEMCKDVTLVGKERVSVPAGSFPALHFRSEERQNESWVSAEVPFSLVRSTGKDYQVELTAQGAGATSSIKEKPREMRMGGAGR